MQTRRINKTLNKNDQNHNLLIILSCHIKFLSFVKFYCSNVKSVRFKRDRIKAEILFTAALFLVCSIIILKLKFYGTNKKNAAASYKDNTGSNEQKKYIF